MKNFLTLFLMCLFLGLSITGCTSAERKNTGMLTGGVLGGVAGSALTGGSAAGTIVGAVGGGFVGRAVTN